MQPVHPGASRAVSSGEPRGISDRLEIDEPGGVLFAAGSISREGDPFVGTSKRIVGIALLIALAAPLLAPVPARASENGRRNTTYALGALTAYFLARKQWIPAALGAAGTYAAYHNYQAAVNARHRRERALAYRYSSYHSYRSYSPSSTYSSYRPVYHHTYYTRHHYRSYTAPVYHHTAYHHTTYSQPAYTTNSRPVVADHTTAQPGAAATLTSGADALTASELNNSAAGSPATTPAVVNPSASPAVGNPVTPAYQAPAVYPAPQTTPAPTRTSPAALGLLGLGGVILGCLGTLAAFRLGHRPV
jgi:hypothetical protein